MQLFGMSRDSGAPLAGVDHLVQSIRDILTTRKGTRRMRPEYGSDLPSFVDLPVNAGWASAAQAEIANALSRWEPRIKIQSVQIESIVDGTITIRIVGEYLGDNVILQVTTA